MAQQFIPAVLQFQNFENAVILSPIAPPQYHGINFGSISSGPIIGTAEGIILGEGEGRIAGVALNACFISSPNNNIPNPESIDPPVIYTFCNATQPYGRDFLNLNLKMIRANDYAFNIQVVLNGTPVNLNGGTLRMSAKWRPTDPDGSEIFSVFSPSNGISFINAASGTATVTIAGSLTNTNAIPFHRIDPIYDIQYTNAAGQRYTVMYGTLTILPNISETSP